MLGLFLMVTGVILQGFMLNVVCVTYVLSIMVFCDVEIYFFSLHVSDNVWSSSYLFCVYVW